MELFFLKFVLLLNSFLCVDSTVLPDDNQPAADVDWSDIRPAIFTSAIEMKEYLYAHGVTAGQLYDPVVNNNWELENLCEIFGGDGRMNSDDDEPETEVDGMDREQMFDRKRRSAAPLFCSGQCERSLCPWDYTFNINLTRTPPIISRAVCRRQTCSFEFAGLSYFDRMKLKTDTFCDVIRQDIMYYQNGEQKWLLAWPVGCMCSRHRVMRMFDTRANEESSQVEHSISGQVEFLPRNDDYIMAMQSDQPYGAPEDTSKDSTSYLSKKKARPGNQGGRKYRKLQRSSDGQERHQQSLQHIKTRPGNKLVQQVIDHDSMETFEKILFEDEHTDDIASPDSKEDINNMKRRKGDSDYRKSKKFVADGYYGHGRRHEGQLKRHEGGQETGQTDDFEDSNDSDEREERRKLEFNQDESHEGVNRHPGDGNFADSLRDRNSDRHHIDRVPEPQDRGFRHKKKYEKIKKHAQS